jgi:hypothetical protein
VVFADDFESTPAGNVPKGYRQEHGQAWNIRWDHTWGVPAPLVVTEPEHMHAGRQAIELTKDERGAIGLSKYFAPGFDRLFLRYYVKYDDDYFPGAHHVGGGIEGRAPGVPFANPGVVPDGTNKFTVLLDHWRNEPRATPPGPLVAYVYHMDQRHKWGEQFYPSGRTRPPANGQRGFFGPAFVPRRDIVPERGRWYCFELMVQMNTPEQRDGRVAFWVDGRLAGDFPNLRLVGSRSHADPLVAELQAAMGIAEVRPRGSVGLKCALIAEGESDVYVHPVPHMKEWDTCAPKVILREAGGMVVDCRGEPLRYNKADPAQPHGVVARAPGVLDEVLRRLGPLYAGAGSGTVATATSRNV